MPNVVAFAPRLAPTPESPLSNPLDPRAVQLQHLINDLQILALHYPAALTALSAAARAFATPYRVESQHTKRPRA